MDGHRQGSTLIFLSCRVDLLKASEQENNRILDNKEQGLNVFEFGHPVFVLDTLTV